MKLKVILTALLMGGLMSSAMAYTMCEKTQGRATGLNLKSVASLTNTDSGGSPSIIAGETQLSNLAFPPRTVSFTECGNVVIASSPESKGYPDLCSNYYEPNEYQNYSHVCKTGAEVNEGAFDLVNNNFVQVGVMNCQRDNTKPCKAP